MKIAFLTDSLEKIDPEQGTTSHLMYECSQRGHEVYFLHAPDIYVRQSEIWARIRKVSTTPHQNISDYWRTLVDSRHRDELSFETLTALDVIFLRTEPALQYQVMGYLSSINDRVLVLNSGYGQIFSNSNLYILNFPDIIPETHISRDPSRLKRIINDFGGDMVIKPLHYCGGHGVIKVSNRDRENLYSLINYYVGANREYHQREPIMVQEYLGEVKRCGCSRILLLNGEILGAIRKMPTPGIFEPIYMPVPLSTNIRSPRTNAESAKH